MLETPPRLYAPVLLAVLAGCLMVAGYEIAPGPLSSIAGLIGVVVGLTACVSGVNWLWYRGMVYYNQIQNTRAETAQVRIMREIARMTPEQIAYANSLQIVIRLLPGEPAPALYAIVIGDVSIPFDFVKMFISLSDSTNLAPVRQWPDGSLNRQYATYLTNHLITMGYAKPGTGNQSARWTDRLGAMRALGLVMPDDAGEHELVTIDWLSRTQIARDRRRRHEAER